MTLATMDIPRLSWKVAPSSDLKGVMCFLLDCRMINKGYLSYLAYVCDTSDVSFLFWIIFELLGSLGCVSDRFSWYTFGS